jgi:hypothetical protein
MTPESDTALLGRLEAALAVETSPSEWEIAELRALVAGPSRVVYAFPRLETPRQPSRTAVRAAAAAAAAVVAAVVVALSVVVAESGTDTPVSTPSAVAPAHPTVDPAPASVATEMAAVRDALERRDLEAVISAKDELVRALDALSPNARALVQPDAESLLARVEAFLADVTQPRAADPPAPDPPAAVEVLDEPLDEVAPGNEVTPAPTTPPSDDEPEPEDH